MNCCPEKLTRRCFLEQAARLSFQVGLSALLAGCARLQPPATPSPLAPSPTPSAVPTRDQAAAQDATPDRADGAFEPRTTTNFQKLLRYSEGTRLRHAIVVQTNILFEATEAMVTAS